MTPARAADQFKMGLLVPGSVADEGWNRIAYNALKQVEKQLGAKVSYVELQQNPASFEKAFRDYAAQGYNVVMGHGFEFQDAALTVAEDYPDVWFLISSSSIHKGKVIGLNTNSSQPFYLMGVIAAKMGKVRRAGRRDGDSPDQGGARGLHEGRQGHQAGHARELRLCRQFRGPHSGQGSRGQHDRQGRGFRDSRRRRRRHGRHSGCPRGGAEHRHLRRLHRYHVERPRNVLGTYLADYATGVERIVSGIKDGSSLPASNVAFGLKDADVMKFYYNDKAKRSVPEDVRAYVDGVKAKIVSGEIKTLDK